MEIKTILFLILSAHACSAFNISDENSFAVDATTIDLLEVHHKKPQAAVGRSFSVLLHTQTDEPIDLPDSVIPNKTGNEISRQASRSRKRVPPCIISDTNATKCNQTTIQIFRISEEAVDFLKSPLVTRIMPSFYIFIILISLPLNALALVAFTCRIQVKKPAVIYMSHLACVDLLFTLLLPLKIHYQLNSSDWVFGEALCRVISAAYYCYMYCSILLMMCMSVDRLLAVVFPIASLTWRSMRKASCVCVLVWLLALAGTVPLLLVRQTFKIKDVGLTCHDALIHSDPKDQQYMYQFSILSIVYFFVPLITTLVSYSTIIYVLHTKCIQFVKSSSLSDKRRRAVIMVITVLMVFVLCFAPSNGILLYHCVRLATGYDHGEGDSSYKAYLIAVCLGSSSVFLDPLLYYYGSSQCRQKISSVFWWRWGKSTSSNSCSQSKSSFLSSEYSQARIKM
ncbi:proteinase-activated receptor 1-like [Puntigrus tetrazona]|uniref:proteinase-activated receptor 1-like n=1 Tax=Puntigrus tetrazona TaxID=1606681 RepID=UPI001C8949D7|nr:proteinase-activated receptor 1-like [Puntigrus tetrazona]